MVAVGTWRAISPAELTGLPEVFSFSWPTPEEERAGRKSVAQHGVLRPLLCRPAADHRLELVSGARRLAWAVQAGVVAVPVAVLEPCSAGELWQRLLADARDHRPLNPVEVGLYLRRRTSHTGETLEALAAGVLPALGLPPRVAGADDVLWVSGLPPEDRTGFADGSRPVHAARLLRGASREDALAVLAHTRGLAGGVNTFTEVVRGLLECAWRDGLPLTEWMQREGLGGEWSGLDALRVQVRRRRYPQLSRWEQTFPAAIGGAGLPPDVSVHPPRGFEGGRYQCRVTFTSLNELRQALTATLERLDQGRLEALREFLE